MHTPKTKSETMELYKEFHNKPNDHYTPKTLQRTIIDVYLGTQRLYKENPDLIGLHQNSQVLLVSILSEKELMQFYESEENRPNSPESKSNRNG